jgi:hypothetical protein
VTAILAVTACAMAMTAVPAGASDADTGHGNPDPIKVIATGLNDPFQVSTGYLGTLLVTESFAGQITAVDVRSGRTKPLITNVPAASGASLIDGKIAIVTGAGEGPPEDAAESALTPASAKHQPPAGEPIFASLLVGWPFHAPRQLANLEQYELEHNPDGQVQFDPVTGAPLDALSNPFSVIADRNPRGFALVADGGANDVLAVNAKGKVTTFFVPPQINTGGCAGQPNNDAEHTGCDQVPTGLAYGPSNRLYVTTENSLVPGEGRVYVVDAARTKDIKKVLTGFTSPTGVAVDNRGNVYVAELLEGAPPEGQEPPPGFNPSEVGQIVKVAPNGTRSYAQVTMPNGLLYSGGKLYATAWSVANQFFGSPNAGQVVQVNDSAFVPAAS